MGFGFAWGGFGCCGEWSVEVWFLLYFGNLEIWEFGNLGLVVFAVLGFGLGMNVARANGWFMGGIGWLVRFGNLDWLIFGMGFVFVVIGDMGCGGFRLGGWLG